MRRVLALSPHTDDVELAMGGTLALHLERGDEVHVIAFSTGNVRCGASIWEFSSAMEALKLPSEKWELIDYPAREFLKYRQEILDSLIDRRREVSPDLVYIPSQPDCHQDHEVIAKEAIRAFRKVTILGYELPWNAVIPFGGNHFVRLEEHHMVRKLEALRCYESQARRAYAQEKLIWALAQMRGVMCGAEFAEAFEVIRQVQ